MTANLTHSLLCGALVLSASALTAQCPPGGYPPPPPAWGEGTAAPSTPGPAAPSTPGPASPSTPGPASPSTPAAGPATGGPSGPSTPAGRPTTGGVGRPAGARMPITFTRGQTSKNMLDIDWSYPIAKPAEVKGEGTSAQPVFQPLAVDAAFAEIAGDDPRPLLVVRECPKCQGSDAALLHPKQANDRTILLTHFFHCVKLDPSILHDTHPYRKLFEGREDAHVFLATADGATVETLGAMHSPSSLWRTMSKVLKSAYDGNADGNVKQLLKLLDQFDRVDEQELRLFEQMEEEIESNGPSSPRLAQLRKKRSKVEADKAELMKRKEALLALPLRAAEAENH